jgi:16S rRNA (cytosine1402-N4)-methyltransferase
MDRTQPTTAADLVNGLPREALADLFARYGEERQARRLATAIARARSGGPIATTRRLAAIVEETTPARGPRRIHPATRIFQALRIAVNDELSGLDRLLDDAATRLRPRGRIAVIAFHSLEDRIVKNAFRALASRCVCPPRLPVCGCGRPDVMRLVTRKPVRPGPREIRLNPRSRSARLRVAERLETP